MLLLPANLDGCSSGGEHPHRLSSGSRTAGRPVYARPVIWTFDYPLQTERLNLRPHTIADLYDLAVFHGDPDVTRYIPWPVRDREQVRAALVAKIPQISASTTGEWIVLAVEERRSRTVIGEVLLKRESDCVAEVGYAFATQAQGKGLATEAVVHLMDVSQRELGITTFDAVIEEPNVASARLLARAGFVPAPSTEPGLLSFQRTVTHPMASTTPHPGHKTTAGTAAPPERRTP